MRILICDDDTLFATQLKEDLSGFFHNINAKSNDIVIFESGRDLLSDTGIKDIVFLDVEMPGIDGISIGNQLKASNNDIIIFIISAHSEYLDDAMRFHVFRYLTKPLDRQRLFRNMNDALQLYHLSITKISIETKQDTHIVSSSDIVMVETRQRRVTVYTTNAAFESIHNMQHWTNILNMHSFFPTHRSYIINLKYVSDFNQTMVYLCGKKFSAYLTRRKYTQFKEAYLLYLESTR